MQIIRFSKEDDHTTFLEERRGTVGGSDVKTTLPLKRGTDKRPSGIWKLIAGKLFVSPDAEKARDRGLRVELAGVEYVATKFSLNVDFNPGMWIADYDKDIHSSPDGAEVGDNPSFAIENKALDSHNHIMAIVKDLEAKHQPNYNPFNSLKISTLIDFSNQCIQYFAVNDNCQKVYFNLHDDRAGDDCYMNYTIMINRSDIPDGLIESQKWAMINAVNQSREIIKFIVKELRNK